MANYYTSTIQKGSKGDEVKKWQTFLNTQGYGLSVDGDFGDKTYAATTDYQSKNGLGVDGIVGANTWGKAGYTLSPSSQDWSYGDFQYDDFTYDDYDAPDKFTYKDYEAPDEFKYANFTYDKYKESDTVKNAGTALNAHLTNKPKEYQSQWQGKLDALMGQIMNREKFSYNFNEDALYQQYKDKYVQQGKLAMADTMGQAAALTGGYGSSYAQSVGQQAYQQSLDNLNDIVPELYQMALDKYNTEGQDLYNQYGMVMDRENQDYGRYRDKVGDWQTDRGYLQGVYDSERDRDYGRYADDRNFAYGKYSDDRNLAYTKYENDRNFGYNQYINDKNFAYGQYIDDKNFDYNQYINDKNFAYGQYSDDKNFDYNQYINDKNFAYGQYSDDRNLAYNEYATDKNLSYQQYRDAIADEQWQKQYDESVRQYNDTMSFNQAQANKTSGDTGGDNQQAQDPNQTPVVDPNQGSTIPDSVVSKVKGYTTEKGQADYLASEINKGTITEDQAIELLNQYGVTDLVNRSWEVVEDGGINFLGIGINANAKVSDGTTTYTLAQLRKELQKNMSYKEANDWIIELEKKLGIRKG